MHSFRRRRLARSVMTLIAVMGVMLTALGWYTPQPARAQTASLLINNHLCPNPISSIDMIDLAPNCPGVGSNWSFTVTHTGGLYQQTLQTDAQRHGLLRQHAGRRLQDRGRDARPTSRRSRSIATSRTVSATT